MKHFIGVLFVFLSFTVSAQSTICGTDYFLEKEYQKDPSFQNLVEQNWALSDGPSETTSRGSRAVKVIPVVFHVIHANGAGDISYDQVLSALDMINEDFRRTNSDTANTRDIFKPFAVDTEIEFRLAQKDPSGNCTNGVVRINNYDESYNADNSAKALSVWPADEYFNIWVVNSIESSGVSGIILGYAQFPGSGSWNNYGVIIRNDRVGTIGTATAGDRTLTHEIGHCLNLLHTFQSGCGSSCQSTGDRVCDTPPVATSTQGCNRSQNSCSNDASGTSDYTTDVVDQIENYMSYDDCQNMFSIGQNARMQNVFTNFSQLQNLISATNLSNTGVLNTTPSLCEAEFESNSQVICEGQTISFSDKSFFNPTGHQWSFKGGSPETSTNKNEQVTYSAPGTYEVTLTVTDAFNNSISSVKKNYITVLSSLGQTTPLRESFEGGFSLPDVGWFTDQYPENYEWLISTGTGATGSNSIKASAFAKTGVISTVSPAYDTRNLDTATLTFKHAYAPYGNSDQSYLKVLISSDCGVNWYVLKVIGGNGLASSAATFTNYSNPTSSEWKFVSIPVSKSLLTGSTRIKFEFYSANGNNLFMDDIGIFGNLNHQLNLNHPRDGSADLSVVQTLNWNASNTVDYYTVEMDTDTSFNTANYVTQQLNYISIVSTQLDTEFETDTLTDGETYYWRVKSTLNGIDTAFSETWSFSVNSNTVGITDAELSTWEVLVYPNPSHAIFNVSFEVSESETVIINLYDLTGKQLKTLHNATVSSGKTQLSFDTDELAKGVYILQIQSNTGQVTKKLIIK
jgi:PKD repeat protein